MRRRTRSAAVQEAANRGIRIYTVGIGSPTGALLHINGFTVESRLDAATSATDCSADRRYVLQRTEHRQFTRDL